ncbi:MAG: trypsin-like peptidase domain-containing protein [Anaerolineaceae bacterium]|nr:trypsin-like peptidase domain-containing protein [Anaerolineaceae bacterium]
MQSRRTIWVGLIIGSLILIVVLCVSCGYFFTAGHNLSVTSTITSIPQQIHEIKDLPTPALQIEVPSFAEGELPVGAAVQILVKGTVEGSIEEWSGSGTIISPDGLILTNAHVAVGDRFYRADRLIIALTVAEDKPPVPAYLAEVVQADSALDIAVLRIAYDLSGQRVDPSDLNLPFVQLGDSDKLRLGDAITILGYPGIGGETITLTRGEVSGFTAEAGYGNRAFIKTSATIAGGNSGGLATDVNNKLVGIPSQVGAGEVNGDIVDCRPLADTNRDGYINEYDTCVPTGGFINALRPINLAIPLINAAVEGKEPYTAIELPEAELPAGGEIIYKDDFSDEETGWPQENYSDESFYYQNGRYYIMVNDENKYRPITGGENLRDIIIQIDARVEQSSGDGDFGVICRYQDENNLYMFEITQDAYYAIYKLVNGEWYPLIEYTYSDMLINLEEARFNLACIGDTLSFAVNGKLLGEVSDQSFSTGDYGFFAGTFDSSGNLISFDNLTVSLP